MSEVLLKKPVELKLPAEQNMMLVLRLTTAGVVARAGLTVDRMDDVKMAVEEACSFLIASGNARERMSLRFEMEEDMLKIHICADGNCAGAQPGDEGELDVVRCILESLVDDVEFRMHEERIGAIELRVKLGM